MAGIPSELTGFALTLLGLFGGVFATWLARRGKKEDTRISETNQTFSQLNELAQARLAEIVRLAAAKKEADGELERIRTSWEARWDRQMSRCRKVTDSLTDAIEALKKTGNPNSTRDAGEVLRVLEAHQQDDHPDGAP